MSEWDHPLTASITLIRHHPDMHLHRFAAAEHPQTMSSLTALDPLHLMMSPSLMTHAHSCVGLLKTHRFDFNYQLLPCIFTRGIFRRITLCFYPLLFDPAWFGLHGSAEACCLCFLIYHWSCLAPLFQGSSLYVRFLSSRALTTSCLICGSQSKCLYSAPL